MQLGEITVTLKSLFWQEPSQPDAYRSAFPLLRSGKHGLQPSPEKLSSSHSFIYLLHRQVTKFWFLRPRDGGERAAGAVQQRGGPASCPLLRSQRLGRGEGSCSWSWALSPGKGGHRHTSDTTGASWPATSSQCLQGIACILKENGTAAGLALHGSAPAASCGMCRIWVELGLFF